MKIQVFYSKIKIVFRKRHDNSTEPVNEIYDRRMEQIKEEAKKRKLDSDQTEGWPVAKIISD
jgi:hypothetical protein